MDRPLSHQPKDPNKHCLPLARYAAPHLNPFSHMGFWVAKSIRRASFPNGFLLRKPCAKVGLGRSARFCGCPLFREARQMEMEDLVEKSGVQDYGLDVNGGEGEFLCDSVEEENHGTSSSSETTSSEEPKSGGDTEESSGKAAPLGWPLRKSSESTTEECKNKSHLDDGEMEKIKTSTSEIEMMKERFSKLLLGEDMSGCGKGVCTALAISNAITNLCATIFGQLWRLEPLSPEKKSMWRREMEWLLCVSDHIVELIPSWQTFPDGSNFEIMSCRPRSDLYINIPALQKLDNMLLEILDSFCDTEFWYVDQGILAPNTDGSSPFWKHVPRQEEKWWLPVPRVPPGGLHEMTRKELQHKRECTKQILKAAMAINSNALAEMEIPESYLDTLPKNGRASLGDVMYRYITSDQFSPECLLDCLDFASEYQALEIANRVEASIYIWRRRAATRPVNTSRSSTKSSWGVVKEMIVDIEKRGLLADRAESVLLCLKQRFPGLTQTSLDMSKIQFNKDVGKSILESYSRVLESLASNIVARIDDLLYIDDLTKHSDKLSSVPTASVVAHERVSIPYSVPVSSTPYATAYATPNFLPAPLDSPAREGRTPFVSRSHTRGFGVKKVLTDYLGVEVKGKNNINVVEVLASIRSANQDGTAS